jgi:hypothetical protein
MTATVRKYATATIVPALALVLILLPAVLLTGCSKTVVTTTTTTEVETTTSTSEAAPDTSTTATTEAEQTTTSTTEAAFPPTVNHEQDDSRLVYAGTWSKTSASSASSKSFIVANKSGCSVTVHFYGTKISWIAKKSPSYGQAKVTVDGGTAQTIDLYSSSTVWKKKVWTSATLKLGDHTVTIAWTGKKNSKATDTNINIDAIITTGVLTATYEQNNSKFTYAGTWTKQTNSGASGGGFVYADSSDASVTVQFSGTRLVWIARTGPTFGQAKVTLDGEKTETVDLYGSSSKNQQKVWDSGVLESGTHTVKIEWTGQKKAASKGTVIAVDAFQVTGSLK